jgi:hypothetical protein
MQHHDGRPFSGIFAVDELIAYFYEVLGRLSSDSLGKRDFLA